MSAPLTDHRPRDLRRTLARAVFVLAASLGAAMFTSASLGCETTEGVGEDIENLGEGIDEAAENGG